VNARSLLACALLAACRREAPRPASITQQDDWNRTVALAAPAQRIVSLAPATTELVFALGLGDRLVGRTTWCDFPAEAKNVANVGNGIGPNVEAIAARRPDLVLVYPSESNRPAVGQFDRLGIPAAVLGQDAISQWRATVHWVARAAGVPERADSLLADFDRRLAASRGDTMAIDPPPARPTVFIAVGANPPIAIGKGSFVSELLELAGGANAFADIEGPSAVVSLEAIVAHRPDAVLVLGPDSTTREIAQRPGWQALGPVRGGRILAVDGGEFNRPSPRIPDAVSQLRAKLAAVRAQCYQAGVHQCPEP
jgi:iron complex transport system substrate-binding protein